FMAQLVTFVLESLDCSTEPCMILDMLSSLFISLCWYSPFEFITLSPQLFGMVADDSIFFPLSKLGEIDIAEFNDSTKYRVPILKVLTDKLRNLHQREIGYAFCNIFRLFMLCFRVVTKQKFAKETFSNDWYTGFFTGITIIK